MNLNSFACLFFVCSVCYSCSSQENGKINQDAPSVKEEIEAIDIDSFYFILTSNRSLDFKEIQGQFVYLESNADKGEYLARFISESIERPIEHTRYSGDKKDILSLGSTNINLKEKIDPLSIKIYTLLFTERRYLIFVGKAQSASGSGVQVTFFNIIKLKEKGEVENHYEFESRFGTINSIVDYNKDGILDYFKIVNADKAGEYRLTINNAQSDVPISISSGYMMLKYELNDKFMIIEDSLKR